MALPKSKYEILCAIVAQMRNSPTGLVKSELIANACGYPLDVVMQNFGFFTSAGILTAGMNKALSEDGSLLSYAIHRGDSAQIVRQWRVIIDKWPEMLKLLKWLGVTEETSIADFMNGAEALFYRDSSSSCFALNCLVHLARRLGYIDVVDKKVIISEYGMSLLEEKPPRASGGYVKNFPERGRGAPMVPTRELAPNPDKRQGEDVHIHLHFGSGIDTEQIETIFRSLAESVIKRPDAAATSGQSLKSASIMPFNP